MDFNQPEEFIGDGIRFDRSHRDRPHKDEQILFPLVSGAIAVFIAVAPMTVALFIGQKLISRRLSNRLPKVNLVLKGAGFGLLVWALSLANLTQERKNRS